MSKEELKEMLKNYMMASQEELDVIMEDIDDLKSDIAFLRRCDSDCSGEVSDNIICQILEYICK